MIADNRLTENSAWNEILFGKQLKALSEVELDFSLEATGFAMADNLRIEALAPSTSSAQDPADVLSEAPAFALTNLGACGLPEVESPPPSVTLKLHQTGFPPSKRSQL